MGHITQKRLLELFDYSDGNLVRKIGRAKGSGTERWKVGSLLGHKSSKGYVLAGVDYKHYKLHRLIWLWHKGSFPKNHLDHIDGDPSNNRIENLREATDAENIQNQKKARKNNRLGVQGVYQVNGKFRASLTTNGKAKHLGYFSTPEDAHDAYLKAKREMHKFSTI